MLNANPGIVQFYYTKNLPNESVAIAEISGTDFSPASLISINNSAVLDQGLLAIWKNSSSLSGPADFTAPDINQTITINGSVIYYIDNQFFEITNRLSNANNPMYYMHLLPLGITTANILDSDGNILDVDYLLSNNVLFHSQPDGYYQVRYVDENGFIQVEMLLFTPVLGQSISTVSNNLYTYSAKVLSVFTTGNYYLRFTANNGYQVLNPYNAPSNVPWFPRIRFGVSPTPPEWAQQAFLPFRPYILASFISGVAINSYVIQFDRKLLYNNPYHLPDILVFDKDNKFKYALDGTPVGTISTKGYEYNWKQGLISSVDNYTSRVEVAVDLDPTDIIFGFYAYQEKDVVYSELDVNPFTNPLIKNAEVTFYLKTNGSVPNQTLFYFITNEAGDVIQTNDPTPSVGTQQIFAQLVVGAAVPITSINIIDARTRGGGLAAPYQNIPQASNFWDLGYWDGQPYPAAGSLLIYLPQSLLNSMSQEIIQSKIEAILPLGILAAVKFYDNEGNEY